MSLSTVLFFHFITLSNAASSTRPFWTEKSSYVDGDRVYVIGTASKVKKEEEGRKQAFENGKIEIQNFAQITDLAGLEIVTQMTFTEQNPDGTLNIFRLMHADHGQILNRKEALAKKTEENIVKIQNQARSEVEVKRRAVETMRKISDERKGLENEYSELLSQLNKIADVAVSNIRLGMSVREVIRFAGQPRQTDKCLDRIYLNYGRVWAVFESGIAQWLC